MQGALSAGEPPGAVAAPNARGKRFGLQGLVLGVAVALLLFLVGYPLLWLILAAFGLPREFGIEYFVRAFTRPQNYSALINTLQLALGTGVMSVVIGVPLAWATARTDIKFRNAVHALVALSYITPPYLTALAYIILLGPDAGQFNRFLRMFIEVNSGPINIFTMGGIIFVIGIHVFAFTYFLTYSALRAVDSSLEESAQILGARRWQTTLRVNLPLVAPAITGGALLAAIRFTCSVWTASDHRDSGADRVPAHAHLRHHRQLSAALGGGVGLVARAGPADSYRSCRAAQLS